MSYQMIKKQFKLGLFTALIGNLLWLGMVNVSADDTVISDSPTVSALTKKVEAAKIAAKAAAEKIVAEKAAAAAKAALATNMVSEVAVEYTANTYPAGQCTWVPKKWLLGLETIGVMVEIGQLVRQRLDMKWELLQKLALLLYGQMEATVMLPM